MYPESHESALLEQLLCERAISDLTELALELWLPLAEKAVLQATAAPPPDPTAAADQDGQWSYLVDALILYGVGIIAADAYDKAFAAISGAPLTIGAAVAAAARKADMPGMPPRSQLSRRASAILSRRLGINVASVEQRLDGSPQMRSFVSEHVAAVGRRVIDAVARVFNRARRATEEASTSEQAREEVAGIFDPLDPQWQAAADEVGQTHGTGTLNAALEQAARDTGRDLEIAWVAILDSHTRLAHEEADGQRRAPGVAFDVGGEPLRFPGDPLGDLDNTINCRCRLFAYFTSPALQAAVVPQIIQVSKAVLDAVTWAKSQSGKPYVFGASHASDTMATKEARPMTDYRSFTSVLAVIGVPTDDGRMFATDIDLSFRDMPLPLMWCKQSSGGHYDAFTVGVIESAGVVGNEVIGKGYMLNTAEAKEATVEIEHKVTGPSVDLGSVEWELRDTNGQPITEDEWWDNPDMEVVQTVLSAKVLAATLVSTPAFGETSIELGEFVAKGEDALVAAVSVTEKALARPQASAFADPQFTEPTYPHMTEDGVIRGHLAAWNVCHVGIADRCVLAPHSLTDYTWFHTSPPVQLADGGKVKVGRLTVGGGHAGPKLGIIPAIEHYDNVGTCFGLVHVGEDEHGVWFAGIPAPGATPEQIAQGLAAPLSGDWRNVGGNLELVAALSVNTPGFPLVASGATDAEGEQVSLVASLGPCPDTTPQTPSGSDGLNPEQLRAFIQIVLEEQRSSARREVEAKALITGEVRRQAAAIIEGASRGM